MTNPLGVVSARWPFRAALAVVGALALASCSITEPGRSARTIELTRNRQLWTSVRLHDYEFDYQLSCFCGSESTESVHVIVRGDQISAAFRTRDGLPALRPFGTWPTVADLFDDVQQQLERKAERLEITYDPTYGYPRSIIADVSFMIADDESSQTASNLRPLP
ncbi:MAG: DUF6174 domain-containing protein [bacterium]